MMTEQLAQPQSMHRRAQRAPIRTLFGPGMEARGDHDGVLFFERERSKDQNDRSRGQLEMPQDRCRPANPPRGLKPEPWPAEPQIVWPPVRASMKITSPTLPEARQEQSVPSRSGHLPMRLLPQTGGSCQPRGSPRTTMFGSPAKSENGRSFCSVPRASSLICRTIRSI